MASQLHTEEAYDLLPLMFMNVCLADNLYQFSYLMAKNEVTFLNQIEGLAVVLMTILALILVLPYNMYGVVLANTIARTINKALMSCKTILEGALIGTSLVGIEYQPPGRRSHLGRYEPILKRLLAERPPV
jgi:hypothetical protein